MKRSLRLDDRGSMPLTMLVVTVVLALSATLAPIVMRQIESTQVYDERNVALDAAQAGLDVMMARVRAAADDEQNGYLENLPPCKMSGTAGLNAAGEQMSYTVSVLYRDQDGKETTNCTVNDVPATAVVTAVGTNGPVTRTLTATYVFTTSNTNIPGGRIKIKSAPAGLGDQCLDAGSAKSPASGTVVTARKCNGSSQQQFGYTPDLYLKLIHSETSSAPSGMCLFAQASRTNGTPIIFRPCPTVRNRLYQWALDGNSLFHATNADIKSDSSFCMNVKSPTSAVDRAVVLDGCGVTDDKTVWYAAPGVGAGMAGDATNQLVNYKQFSRCLDVTSKKTDSKYMIAWFCKQDPGALVDFNQQWVHPVPVLPAILKSGPIVVNNYSANSNSNSVVYDSAGKIIDISSKDYCLTSPGTATATSWVTVTNCPNAASKTQPTVTWTVYHDTGDYGTSYRIMDYKGNCLQPTSQDSKDPEDFHGDGTSKVKVAVCDTSDLQKWNAPANINQPTPLIELAEK
ncbi:ricin-type beta-trefoil lectin domain protein [Actinoplanes sp. NPDC049802]|uniref:RICIN domain-containing protein n=1 Tax=Actinoplanes sp. NPDC049802 TaxID=3154742 RepID=UPI0033DC4978